MIVSFLIELVACILLVDFLTGFFHWLEDSYFDESTPIIGKLVIGPNLEHHVRPMAFTESTYWERNAITIYLALAFAGVSYLCGVLTLPWGLAILLGSQGNQIHYWTHIKARHVPSIIWWLQRFRILQTQAHHVGGHHGQPFDDHYCIITNIVNPVLDTVRFWRGVEWIIYQLTGVRPRHYGEGKCRKQCPTLA